MPYDLGSGGGPGAPEFDYERFLAGLDQFGLPAHPLPGPGARLRRWGSGPLQPYNGFTSDERIRMWQLQEVGSGGWSVPGARHLRGVRRPPRRNLPQRELCRPVERDQGLPQLPLRDPFALQAPRRLGPPSGAQHLRERRPVAEALAARAHRRCRVAAGEKRAVLPVASSSALERLRAVDFT